MKIKLNTLVGRTIIYIITFITTSVLCAGMLVMAAFVPRNAIFANMLTSAEHLCDDFVFFKLSDDIDASIIDRYADSILLNIAYNFDPDDSLGSVMRAEYYSNKNYDENVNFINCVAVGNKANTQYIRYWHGAAAIVRATHLFTDIRGMYIINACIMGALTVLLLLVLIWHKLYAGAVGYTIAIAAAGIWYVPFSLEYTWVFLILPAVSVIAVLMTLHRHTHALGILFLISGIVTNFLDFLTSETLTLTVPLLLVIYTSRKIRRDEANTTAVKTKISGAVEYCVVWGIGYVGMWVLKWVSAAVILGEDISSTVFGHIAERSFGSTTGEESIPGALARNFACLFPVGYGGIGAATLIVILLATAYLCFVYRRGGIQPSDILIYAAIGLIPYIRYIVLMNHSYIHFFFTYRAQAATVLALAFIIYETAFVGRGANKHKKSKTATKAA